ncbi:MAG TPA: hypothetical protein VIG99_12570 [Myxococcaceae bacterium]|jgi:hypothetical protein
MEPSFADRMPTGPAFAICFLAFHVMLSGMGYGAALLLLPRALARDALAFAPLLGFCVLAFGGWHFMFLGLPGTNAYWPWLLLIGAALTVTGCVLRRERLRETLDRDVAWLALCAAAGAFLLASPMTRQPHLTVISALNNDPAHYSAVERLLQERRGDTDSGPEDPYSLIPVARDSVTGAYLGTAVLGSALGVPAWRLQQPCVAVFLFWTALFAGLFAMRVLRFGRLGAMLVALIAGAASLTLFTAWNGFKSQFAAMALAVALFVVLVPALEEEPARARLPAAFALTLGLALTYPHMLLLVWGVLGAVAAAHALRRRSWRQLGRAALLLGGLLAALAVTSPTRAGLVVRYTLFTAGLGEVGWFNPWTTPAAFLGLSGEGFLGSAPPRGWVEVLTAVAFAGLLAWGVHRARNADRPALVTAAAVFATVAFGYLALCISGQFQGRLGGYKSYKLLTFFYPVMLPFTLLAFRELRAGLATWRERAALGAAIALSAGVVFVSAASIRQVRDTSLVVTPELAGLQQLEGDPRFESINIVSPEWWEPMWQTTFLLKKRLFHKDQTYYPRSERLEGRWTLLKVAESLDPVLRADPGEGGEVPAGGPYVLVETSRWLGLAYGSGWHESESDHRWTSDQRATVAVQAAGARSIGLELRYWHLTPGATFNVLLDGAVVGRCSEPASCSVRSFDLPAGPHTLAFEDSVAPRSPGPSDPRLLGIGFSQVHLVAGPGAEAHP